MKKNEEKAYGFSSAYISSRTGGYFKAMLEEYAFEDSAIETTVQNYASTMNLICSYCKKDFLELTEEDAECYFRSLERRMTDETAPLSPRTAHTYKKNLNSVGAHFEVMRAQRADGSLFQNPFAGKIAKTEAVKRAERETKLLQQRESVLPEDIFRLLESVKEDNMKYYFILCMIAFCGVESHSVCEMKPEQLYLRQSDPPTLFFFTPIKRMTPKTIPVRSGAKESGSEAEMTPKTIPVKSGTKGSGSEAEENRSCEMVTAAFTEQGYRRSALPGSYNQEFAAFYIENKEDLVSGDFVFYNRNRNPVNFKTISSVLKKHKELLKIPYPLTTKELCGSLYGYFGTENSD